MFLVFVLYVKRWVCQTLLFSISFCFIRYEVGLCNPFNIFFVIVFICYDVGMLNPLYIF